MIDAVIFFGVINVLFELVVLGMIPPRVRLRLLGNKGAQTCLHVGIMLCVITIHWGTVTGTMSAFFSFILSAVTVGIARMLWGYIDRVTIEVTRSNAQQYWALLSPEQRKGFNDGSIHAAEAVDFIYRRRIVGYTKEELV